MDNFITWEQASNLDQLQVVSEKYENICREILTFFTKNTMAQLTYHDMNMEAMELMEAYFEKDYSKFLFRKTEQLFDKMEEITPEIEKMQGDISIIATFNSKIRELKELKGET